MNNNKKEILNDIMNALVTIYCFDYKTAQDKQLVGYTYKNHQTVNATINKCKSLCLRDWDYTILRDETYACIYESMLKIANNYTEDELKMIYSDINTKKLTITNQFLTGVFKSSIFAVKGNLSGHRRDGRNGMIDAHTYCEYTEENLANAIEIPEFDSDIDICFFLEFFEQNKEKFLTKRQLEFLEDPNITKTNKATYRKRIFDNTMAYYKKTFDNCENERKNELETAIKYIENLLDNPNFNTEIIKAMNQKRYVLDAITTHVDMPTMQKFNRGDHSYPVVKKYRVALFKKLNELNTLLDECKKHMK